MVPRLPTNIDKWWIEDAKRRVRTTETLVRKLFDLAKTEADVETEATRRETEKLIDDANSALAALQEIVWDDTLAEAEGQVDFYVTELEEGLPEELAEIEKRVDIVGGLCIVLMDREVQEVLRFLLRMLGNNVEPQENLWDLRGQYRQVFVIDVREAPNRSWDDVIELHEARNCILHNESMVSDDYRKNVRNPVLLEGDKIVTGREKFDHCVSVFSQFALFVINSVAERKGLT